MDSVEVVFRNGGGEFGQAQGRIYNGDVLCMYVCMYVCIDLQRRCNWGVIYSEVIVRYQWLAALEVGRVGMRTVGNGWLGCVQCAARMQRVY